MTVAELQALRDKRAAVWQEMQNVNDVKDRALTKAEVERWDQLEKDLNSLTDQIAVGDKEQNLRGHFAEHQRTLGQPQEPALDTSKADGGDSRDARAAAYRSWVRFGRNGLTADEREALGDPLAVTKELRAQGVATGAAGGYTVPEGFRARIIETMKAFGNVRQVAEVIETEAGNTLPWPTNDDTANVGAILAENTQVTEQDVTLGTANLEAYVYTSKLVRVSLQLLQDAGIDIEGFLSRKLGERISRIQNQHFTTGTGTAQPDGIQTNAAVGKTGAAGQVTTVTYDDLVDLMFSVDEAYQANARWMMRAAALGAVRKLKDASNRPLWEPSLQAGTPDLLLGKPIVANPDMPAPAASVKSILYGDYRAGYVIRDVLGMQLLRLEERYADYLQVGFLAFARADGTQQDASAYKAYQHPAA